MSRNVVDGGCTSGFGECTRVERLGRSHICKQIVLCAHMHMEILIKNKTIENDGDRFHITLNVTRVLRRCSTSIESHAYA